MLAGLVIVIGALAFAFCMYQDAKRKERVLENAKKVKVLPVAPSAPVNVGGEPVFF